MAVSTTVRGVAAAILAGLLLVMVVAGANSVHYQPGVKRGDWAKYSGGLSVSGDKTILSGIPGGFMISNDTQSVRIDVTNVLDSNVSANVKYDYANGTVAPLFQTRINVSIGWGPDGAPLFIGKDLNEGVPLGDSNIEGPHLNTTRTLNLLRVARVASDLVQNLTVTDGQNVTFTSVRHSWDQATGLLVSILFLESVHRGGSMGRFTYVLDIKDTNLWHEPTLPGTNTPRPASVTPTGFFGVGFGEMYVMLGALGAAGVGIAAYVKRSPRKRTSRARRRKGPR